MKYAAIAAAVCWAAAATAADLKTPIREGQVSIEAIKAVMEQAAFDVEIDSDGDLKIADGGLIAFFRVDTERKLITLFAIYRLKASAPEVERLRLINRLNDQVILVRFSAPDETTLWCDYQFSYDGGITPYALINTFRNFARVTRQAVAQHDTEDIVGSD